MISINEYMTCKPEKRKFYERNNSRSNNDTDKNKKQFCCDHSKISGHTKYRCQKVIGYPSNFKGNFRKRYGKAANVATQSQCQIHSYSIKTGS